MLLYDVALALVLVYSNAVIPPVQLNANLLSRLNVFHLKGLRQILRLKTTYIDRANTNAKVYAMAQRILDQGPSRGRSGCFPFAQDYLDRRLKWLGHLLRQCDYDPERLVTFHPGTANANLHCLKRVGQPRKHWTIEVLGQAWEKLRTVFPDDALLREPFNFENVEHSSFINFAAHAHIF